ncbi:MAG TPA: hypothetical protein VF294_13350, partial [Polyangiaceae bacterium]
EKQAIWAGVALQCLPVVAPPAAASAGLGAGSKLGLGVPPLLKGLLVVASLGGASTATYWLTRAPHSPSPPPAAPALGSAQASAVGAPSVTAEGLPAAAAASVTLPAASAATAHAATATEGQSALRDESSAVLEIRRTLRAGDASGALRLLEQARQRFPHGALSQEREALGIEALAKSGAADAASRNAVAFLRAHPKSPYAADVQSFIAH